MARLAQKRGKARKSAQKNKKMKTLRSRHPQESKRPSRASGRPLPNEVCNLRIVTDAFPDYSDLPSFLHSATAQWASPEEKCWALFYWNHIGRRQTAPMILHGLEVTDPIRQFNDYGYTMCSTISGLNCALWHNLGLPARTSP